VPRGLVIDTLPDLLKRARAATGLFIVVERDVANLGRRSFKVGHRGTKPCWTGYMRRTEVLKFLEGMIAAHEWT